jgi:hypothetical protein
MLSVSVTLCCEFSSFDAHLETFSYVLIRPDCSDIIVV